MIGGATSGSGGKALGRHNANTDLNAEVRAGASRGLMSDGIVEQVAELTELATSSGYKNPIRHVYASPPPGAEWGEKEWKSYWTLYEKVQGLGGCIFSEAIHDKPGDMDRPEHRHRVYLALTERGTLVRNGHDYAKQEAVSRITEFDTGQNFTKGAHNIRAATIAQQLGREDVAEAMRKAGLLNGQRARSSLSPEQRKQQERTGISKASVATATFDAWHRSDNGQAFVAALSEQGITLARGDKCIVVIDQSGNTHALNRLLNSAAKANGGDAPKAQMIASRLDGLELPTVAEAKQVVVRVASEGPEFEPPPKNIKISEPSVTEPKVTVAAANSEEFGRLPASSDNSAPLTSPDSKGGGSGFGDSGDGPPSPPGVGASPKEMQDYHAALCAYEERRDNAKSAAVRAIGAANDAKSQKEFSHGHTQTQTRSPTTRQAPNWPWRDGAGGSQWQDDLRTGESSTGTQFGSRDDITRDAAADTGGEQGPWGDTEIIGVDSGEGGGNRAQAFQRRVENARATRGLKSLNLQAILDKLQPEKLANRVVDDALDDLGKRRKPPFSDPRIAWHRAIRELEQKREELASFQIPVWTRFVPWVTASERKQEALQEGLSRAESFRRKVQPELDDIRRYEARLSAHTAVLDKEEEELTFIAVAVYDGDTAMIDTLVESGIEAAKT